jgi:hypothetical protein
MTPPVTGITFLTPLLFDTRAYARYIILSFCLCQGGENGKG